MTEIDRLMTRAAIRLWLGSFLRSFFGFGTIALGLLVLLRLAARLIGFGVEWQVAWIVTGSIVFVTALVWSIMRRRSRLGVARAVDEHAGLREAMSTALCVEGRDDAWSVAAVRHAASLTKRVIIRQAFPARAPRTWYVPLVLLGAFLLSGLLPQQDWLRLLQSASAEEAQEIATIEAKEEVTAVAEELSAELASISDEELARELEEAMRPPDGKSAEEIRRDLVKKLTNINDRLNELSNSTDAQSTREVAKRLNQLRQPGDGPLNELTRALQRSDFKTAGEALDAMMKKLSEGDLSEEQKQMLSKQLANLSEQLADLAQQKKALEEAMKEAGLDPSLADASMEELRQAMQQNPNLTPAQREALEQMAQEASECAGACQSMSAAAAAAAGASSAEGQLGSLSEFGDQLSSLEMMSAEMESIQNAMSECQGQLANLGGQMGQMEGGGLCTAPGGDGTGSRGEGGGIPQEREAAFQTKREKSSTFLQDGPIIGTMLVEGGTVRGDSVQQFSQAVRAGSDAAAEAIESQRVPREYQDAVKHYFGRLEKKANDEKPGDEGE